MYFQSRNAFSDHELPYITIFEMTLEVINPRDPRSDAFEKLAHRTDVVAGGNKGNQELTRFRLWTGRRNQTGAGAASDSVDNVLQVLEVLHDVAVRVHRLRRHLSQVFLVYLWCHSWHRNHTG